jgi:hypothetical protein
MGNNSSNTSNSLGCTSCSQGLPLMSFGAAKQMKTYYNGYVVRKDNKGKYIMVNYKKKYLPKGTRTQTKLVKSPKKKTTTKKKTTKKKTTKKKPQKLEKVVKSPSKKVLGKRLSARGVYDRLGKKAVGKQFAILQRDGTYVDKFLRLRENGSPYFSTKFGKMIHARFPIDQRLLGPDQDSLTGIKNSWPNGYENVFPPAGVEQPRAISLFPLVRNRFGKLEDYKYNKSSFGRRKNIDYSYFG